MLLLMSACNSVDRFSALKKCTVLGDESIVYARGHYVKLFYHFNPDKFADSYKQIGNFDAVTHKNTIDTYSRAIDKISAIQADTKNQLTENLLSACKELSLFSKDFVEEDYDRAFNHLSKNSPLSDEFFIEINQIVKFDHNIGIFDENQTSFKMKVDSYRSAVKDYAKEYRQDIPSDFFNSLVVK